ncbi:hypothetical protein TNCV_3397871 [Trichonephila clavipes]|nr:hypothetical protein TNCV_3397871 [Trichonephila clavipes]
MSYDYVACKRSLECLLSFDALEKIKFLEQVRIVRAQVPPSGGQNYLRQLVSPTWCCTKKRYQLLGNVLGLQCDEAHFWLNVYVNKQNCHIRSEANPQVYVETPLHPEKLTVWCALWAGGIFFKNDEGHNVTVNGDRYRAMITNFFIPELNNHDVQELWFQ